MRPPGKKPSLDSSGGGRMFSLKAWMLIILGILFIVYAFTPPLRSAVNSVLADFLRPLVGLADNTMNMIEYIS